MNKFAKYCPNVWIAECDEEYKKGDIIQLETKHGKEVDCKVYNFLGYKGTKENPKYCYSIVRIEEQSYAERKAERYLKAANNSIAKSNERFEAANEGREFLILGEPIKVGHHSEKRHRALFERNDNRMRKGFELQEKAKEQQNKADYWENKATEITLAMPESLKYFAEQLEKAIEYHQNLKNGTIPKEHSYSLAYAAKDVKELKKKVEIATKLWS